MPKWRVSMAVLVIVFFGLTMSLIALQQASSQQLITTRNRVLEYEAAVATGLATPAPKRQSLSHGVLTTYLEATGRVSVPATLRALTSPPPPITDRTLGCKNIFRGRFDNIKVNQDCSFRRQAEEFIVINPTNPNNLVAGQNDSVIGFNHCGIDYSFDRGKTWGTHTPPFWGFLLADGRTTDAASDPAIAFDSRGNVYFTCVVFSVNAAANGILVMKSNAALGGSFFHSPAPGPTQLLTVNPGVVANDTSPTIFNDKEFINADRSHSSPKRDNVYVTWTRFNLATGAGVGANTPIYFSQSTDGGATWSLGVEISGASAACPMFSGSTNPNACDQDQGSWPEVGPDGTIYVFFANGNLPGAGIQQILMVKCPPAANCASSASWSTPVKVADLIGTHPIGPDTATGCPAGRQCLPPNGYRVSEIGSITGSVDPTNPSRLFATWSDARNLGSNCGPLLPATIAVPPCDNDVFLAVSTNGGATWGATTKISADGATKSAQWQPWSTVGPEGKLYVAYYDRQYGTCETTGCNDITLAISRDAGKTFRYHRLTTASMPNLIPANNPVQAGFLGDYMGIAADKFGAVIVWGDTRGRNNSVEEDIYFAQFRL